MAAGRTLERLRRRAGTIRSVGAKAGGAMKRRSWVLICAGRFLIARVTGALKYLEPFCGVFGDPDA